MQKLFSIAGGKVDSEAGIISGVSVITGGVEALGHGVYIDATTLNQVKASADKFNGGVRVKMDHWSGFSEIVGVLRNFNVELGEKFNCLRADLHLLKKHPAFEQIIEMAASIPESFGLSIAFSGKSEEIDGLSFARCSELYSVDLVDQPAANPNGLFKQVDSEELSDMTIKDFKAKLAELEAGLKSLFAANTDAAHSAELKTQLASLQANVNEQLTTSLASIETLTSEKQELSKNLEAANEATKANDAVLNEAIAFLKLEVGADATFSDKIETLKSGLTTAIAKIGLSNTNIPSGGNKTQSPQKSWKEFNSMNHSERSAFFKAGGKLTD